jgi:hypothetical protein
MLASSLGLNRRARDLNNPFDKLRPAIFNTLRTAFGTLRKKGLSNLADHLENSISSQIDSFVYRSAGTCPPWRFDLPQGL